MGRDGPQHRHEAAQSVKLLDQAKDLRLNRDVERRRRLVRDEDRGSHRDHHRDHDALPHAATELVRIVAEPLRRRRDAEPLAPGDESNRACIQLYHHVATQVELARALRTGTTDLDAELATTAADMRDAVQGQSCPTCGQPFDADQLLAVGLGGHAHG